MRAQPTRRPLPPAPALSLRGFTIIEMMITVLILGIVLGFGIPSFRESIATQRVKTASKTLFSAIQLARSEALRMNGICDVYVVPEAAGDWAQRVHVVGVSSGGAAPAFNAGQVYATCQFDSNNDGDFADAGDITYNNPLATFPAQDQVNGTPAAALANIEFNALGRPTAAIPAINFCDDDGLAQSRWTITLSAVGMPQYSSTTGGC